MKGNWTIGDKEGCTKKINKYSFISESSEVRKRRSYDTANLMKLGLCSASIIILRELFTSC